jgi:hypothetical protein
MKIVWWAYALVTVTLLSSCAASVVSDGDDPAQVNVVNEDLRPRFCRVDSDCPAPGAPCTLCADGSAACPTVDCERHRCVYSFPQCPPPPFDPCAGKACGDTCRLCDPADPGCIETDVVKFCQADGSCSPLQPSCETVFCGGIAGIPCPGAGTCVDDPSDDCDPKNGGADCGGVCTCDALGLCVAPAHWDSSPGVCGCVGATGSCGGNTCGPNEYCCNASCGICAPFGAACIQIACTAAQ